MILCVGNLARTVQPASSIDLARLPAWCRWRCSDTPNFRRLAAALLSDAGALWLLLVRTPARRRLTPRHARRHRRRADELQ